MEVNPTRIALGGNVCTRINIEVAYIHAAADQSTSRNSKRDLYTRLLCGSMDPMGNHALTARDL